MATPSNHDLGDFQDFGELYRTAQGRTWYPSWEDVEAASRIAARVPAGDLVAMKRKFAKCPYWGPRGCPLVKLEKNLSEYAPTRSEVRASCAHHRPDVRVQIMDDKVAHRWLCPECREVRAWTHDPQVDRDQLVREIAAAWRKVHQAVDQATLDQVRAQLDNLVPA